MNTPRVGTFVNWYMRGNTTGAPMAALVLAVHPGGMLSLNVCHASNGMWEFKDGVWHKDARQLEDNRKIAMQHGCWDAIPEDAAFGPRIVDASAERRSQQNEQASQPATTGGRVRPPKLELADAK